MSGYLQDKSLDQVTLRKVFLLATRALYSSSDNYGDLADTLKNFIYSEDLEKQTLPVDLDFNYNPTVLTARRAIYVGLEDIEFTPRFINSESRGSEDNASVVFTQSATTALVVRAVSPEADEALYLTTLAGAYYTGMRPMIMKQLQLARFDLAGISKPTLIDEAPTRLFQTTMRANVSFYYSIESTLEGVPLKNFTLTVNGPSGIPPLLP